MGLMSDTSKGDCRTEEITGGRLITIEGDVDFSRTPGLRQVLRDVAGAGNGRLIVDLTGVPYMDSSGVAVLVETLQAQAKKGKPLILCGLQPKVRGMFEISRLHTVFNVVDTRDAALALG